MHYLADARTRQVSPFDRLTSRLRFRAAHPALAWALLAAWSPVHAADPIDVLRFGDPSSEAAHHLTSQASETGKGALDQPFRRFLPLAKDEWHGGQASFRLKVGKNAPNYLTVRMWGGEANANQATLYCDGKQLGYRHASDIDILDQGTKYPVAPGRFHYVTHPLPAALTRGKSEIACTLRATGPIWRYGSTFSTFQKPMTEASRAFYALIVHADKMSPLDAVEGQAAAAPINASDDGTVLDRVKQRVDRQVEMSWASSRPAGQLEIAFLAKTFDTRWSKGYRSPKNLAAIVAGIDGMWELYKKDHQVAYHDKATPNQGWYGFGLIGQALKATAPFIQKELEQPVKDEQGSDISRRRALEIMFTDSRKWNREHRRLYTNQSMIKDLYGIWYNNEGLIAIGSEQADPHEKLLPFFYESVGLQPWTGSLNAQGKPTYAAAEADARFSVPKDYFETTRKGLTKELGYVGGYGEVLDWVAEIYEATRPDKGAAGDEKIRAQLVKIAQARSSFRYPHWDDHGNRAMRLEAAIGWRDVYAPGDITYAQRPTWDASPLQLAVATRDPKLVGYAQQLIDDKQLMASIGHMMETSSLRTTISLIPVIEEYEAMQGLPRQPHRLPMTAGEADFVFADEEDGVVALKHGDDILYASLYWRANYGISGLARVHHVTPVTDRVATVALDRQEFVPSGLSFTRPDNPHINGTRFSVRYPDDGPVWTAGEKQPVAKLPEGSRYVSGEDNAYAGRADFYQLTYGPYLIAMNSSKNKRFKVVLPSGGWTAMDLVNRKVVPAGTRVLTVAPGQTLVIHYAARKAAATFAPR